MTQWRVTNPSTESCWTKSEHLARREQAFHSKFWSFGPKKNLANLNFCWKCLTDPCHFEIYIPKYVLNANWNMRISLQQLRSFGTELYFCFRNLFVEIKSPVEIGLEQKTTRFSPHWFRTWEIFNGAPAAGIKLKPRIFTFATLATGTHLSTVTWFLSEILVWENFRSGISSCELGELVSWLDDHLTLNLTYYFYISKMLVVDSYN